MFFRRSALTSEISFEFHTVFQKSDEDITLFAQECELSKLKKILKLVEGILLPGTQKAISAADKEVMKAYDLSTQEESRDFLNNVAVNRALPSHRVFCLVPVIRQILPPEAIIATVNLAVDYVEWEKELKQINNAYLIIKPIYSERCLHEAKPKRSCALI